MNDTEFKDARSSLAFSQAIRDRLLTPKMDEEQMGPVDNTQGETQEPQQEQPDVEPAQEQQTEIPEEEKKGESLIKELIDAIKENTKTSKSAYSSLKERLSKKKETKD